MSFLAIVFATLAVFCVTSKASRNYQYQNRPSVDYYRSRSYNQYYYNSYSPSTVGFTVAKTSNQEFTTDGILTFDKVITNVGKAFQLSDSQVKIPTTGLYFFSYFVQTNSTDQDNIDLVKNGDRIVSAMGLNGANGAVLFARRGDKVSVRGRTGTLILSSADNRKASFSGFLIKSGYFDDSNKHY